MAGGDLAALIAAARGEERLVAIGLTDPQSMGSLKVMPMSSPRDSSPSAGSGVPNTSGP